MEGNCRRRSVSRIKFVGGVILIEYFYHPRSAIQINQYQLDTSPFESFAQGSELFRDIDKVRCPISEGD